MRDCLLSNKKLEISILNLSDVYKLDVTKRIDSEYFQNKYLEMDSGRFSDRLCYYNDIIVKGGKRLPPGHDFSNGQGTPYIRAQDIRNSFVISINSPLIEKSTFEKLANYKIEDKDVLVTIVGNSIGEIGFAKKMPKNSVLTENAVAIRSETLPPEVIFVYLMGKYGSNYIQRNTVGTAQPKLSIERIRQFKYPIITKELSERIVSLVEEAFKIHSERVELYSVLENKILDYFDYLSLKTEKNGTTPVLRQLKEIKAFNRMDAEYYQLFYESIEKNINVVHHGKKLIESGIELIASSFKPERKKVYKYIELSNIGSYGEITGFTEAFGADLPSRAKRILKKDDILVSSIEGSLQSCAIVTEEFDGAVCSTGFYVLRAENMSPYFLLALLKSEMMQLLLKKRCSGTILTSINKEEFMTLPIPTVRPEFQEIISKMFKDTLELRVKCNKILEYCKHTVEIAIEEGEEKALMFIDKCL